MFVIAPSTIWLLYFSVNIQQGVSGCECDMRILAIFFYLLLTFLKKYVIIYKDESGIPPLDAKVAGTTPRQHEKGHYNNMK